MNSFFISDCKGSGLINALVYMCVYWAYIWLASSPEFHICTLQSTQLGYSLRCAGWNANQIDWMWFWSASRSNWGWAHVQTLMYVCVGVCVYVCVYLNTNSQAHSPDTSQSHTHYMKLSLIPHCSVYFSIYKPLGYLCCHIHRVLGIFTCLSCVGSYLFFFLFPPCKLPD